MKKKTEISAALLGITAAVILWVTILGREPQYDGRLFYPPFHTIAALWRDFGHAGLRSNFLGNIILFVPVGILVPMVTEWKGKTVLAGFCFSLLIEIMQLITARGCFDPDDLILNTLGCIIGYTVFRLTGNR